MKHNKTKQNIVCLSCLSNKELWQISVACSVVNLPKFILYLKSKQTLTFALVHKIKWMKTFIFHNSHRRISFLPYTHAYVPSGCAERRMPYDFGHASPPHHSASCAMHFLQFPLFNYLLVILDIFEMQPVHNVFTCIRFVSFWSVFSCVASTFIRMLNWIKRASRNSFMQKAKATKGNSILPPKSDELCLNVHASILSRQTHTFSYCTHFKSVLYFRS